ncbi:MAG: acyl-CoA dehydrogenase [Pseudomonadales bacterium]|nr:acyl-CoA dehydrogenase [Pseudomonadales bacterium]
MFQPSEHAQAVQAAVAQFFADKILPNHHRWLEEAETQEEPAIERELRAEARALGLWNLSLPRLAEDEPGTRLSNLEFTGIAEILGRLPWASRVFNSHAPDSPNMELLQLFGTEKQKEVFLSPLLEGECGSCFSMTEPEAASADPSNLETRIVKEGDNYIINGRKWFSSNGSMAKTRFSILVGVTNPDASKSQRQSLIIVPLDSPGVVVERDVPIFGAVHKTNVHTQFKFTNVVVPKENLIGEEGAGFAIGQARLGPARLHHCMRAIGECEVLVSLMIKRAKARSTFGRKVEDYSSTKEAVALSRVELDQVRLLVQKAAWLLDTVGNKAARKEISMIKVATFRTYQAIADRAIQLFGAAGITGDSPAAAAFVRARGLRIADGPDEVHLQTIYRLESQEQDLEGFDPYLGPYALGNS